MRHKYNAVPTTIDNIRFASKAEARYYSGLLLRKRAGEVVVFLRQVPFHLPGRSKYTCDFMEFHADGSVHFIDVKGMETPAFRKNKRQVEELYAPIKIEVVK